MGGGPGADGGRMTAQRLRHASTSISFSGVAGDAMRVIIDGQDYGWCWADTWMVEAASAYWHVRPLALPDRITACP